MRDKFPQAPYERLSADHKDIHALLVPVRQAVADLNVQGNGNGLSRLVDTLRKIAKAWPPHFRMEEEHFLRQIPFGINGSRDAGQPERGDGEAWVGAFPFPPYLTIPFILFNLQPEDRALWLEHMPPRSWMKWS